MSSDLFRHLKHVLHFHVRHFQHPSPRHGQRWNLVALPEWHFQLGSGRPRRRSRFTQYRVCAVVLCSSFSTVAQKRKISESFVPRFYLWLHPCAVMKCNEYSKAYGPLDLCWFSYIISLFVTFCINVQYMTQYHLGEVPCYSETDIYSLLQFWNDFCFFGNYINVYVNSPYTRVQLRFRNCNSLVSYDNVIIHILL